MRVELGGGGSVIITPEEVETEILFQLPNNSQQIKLTPEK
jgi:hypothetical protein